jgi:hypothetical protein
MDPMNSKHLVSLVFFAALASSAHAQGSNECGTAQPITGFGPFAFDNTAATTGFEGQGSALCLDALLQTLITNDVWFAWTAPSSGAFTVATCGGTAIDSKMAVYAANGCPTAGALACNDDACGSQSSISFNATIGSTFMIQLGNFPNAPAGTGTFAIAASTPQTTCGANAGPDVIVGNLIDIENVAPTGALDALSLGTASCNIGTAPLNWFASTNQHPVIGGNLYRYRIVGGSGRFEQIGQSWLKHGFFALSLNLCCANCQGTDGTTLGVNCADPYTAGLNGTQSTLGPRHQVDAHTGAFTFPPANPAFAGTTARRLEFAASDVTIGSGERYFGEAQYVTPDDAAAGNQNNNASYREMSASGGPTNWNFVFAGATQRESPAIRAWAAIEPNVTLNDVQVPGDGLFVLGHRATDLGGGRFHYEYALYNMNSDRSAAQFSVPVPTGVTISNVGFHDVAYRNGDGVGDVNRSGADWTVTLGAGAVTWSTESEAANVNANAIRWGTTYNFRFDANAAPAAVNATIGLWKSGSPGSINSTVDGPGPNSTSFPFCAGDGSATACPCGNLSPLGSNAGCANSLGTAGLLVGGGTASIAADTFVLQGSGMTDGSVLYFQGTAQHSGGAGAHFGDGLRCAGGTVTRLGVRTNVGGASQFPAAGGTPISVVGANAPGNVRTYQAWYRNAAAFCTSSTFNLTNGWQATWSP